LVKLQQEASKLNEELTGQLQNQTLINTQLELQREKYSSIGFIMQAMIVAHGGRTSTRSRRRSSTSSS
jgi:hypothetical protein